VSADKLTRTELKHMAQEQLMDMVSKVFQYVYDSGAIQDVPESQREEYGEVLKREADRVARLMGYEQAWKS